MGHHDVFVRDTLKSESKISLEILEKSLLPDMRGLLEFSSLKLEKHEFVSQELREYYSDVLFSLRRKTGGEARLYVLFEHKSTRKKIRPNSFASI